MISFLVIPTFKGFFEMNYFSLSNLSVNSPFSQCPLRFAFEKETDENSLNEGMRLQAEAENIYSYLDEKTGLIITPTSLCTMLDGKCKFV